MLVILLLVLLPIAFLLLRYTFIGALELLGWAGEQQFVGVIVYIAAWVFLMPFMIAASLFVGIRETFTDDISDVRYRLRRIYWFEVSVDFVIMVVGVVVIMILVANV